MHRPLKSTLFPYTTLFRSDMKTGIRDARASVANDERGHIEVTVEVFDVKHLDRVIGSIKGVPGVLEDRKSTRLNSSHSQISYAVFCLKKIRKNTLNKNKIS